MVTAHAGANAFAGSVALIAGASSGIGAATARLLSREGAIVALCARRADRLQALVDEIRKDGFQAEAFTLDVLSEGSIQEAVNRAVERFGRIDHAFNNAGVGATHKPIAETSAEEYDLVQNTCLRGTFLCIKHELPVMSGGGSIVNTTSVGGLVGVGGSADYSAAKHGVIGLTKSAAIEAGPLNIRVNAIAPGATLTDMYKRWLPTPEDQQRVADYNLMKRVASAEEIAAGVLYLMRDATFTTGSTLVCDGGMAAG